MSQDPSTPGEERSRRRSLALRILLIPALLFVLLLVFILRVLQNAAGTPPPLPARIAALKAEPLGALRMPGFSSSTTETVTSPTAAQPQTHPNGEASTASKRPIIPASQDARIDYHQMVTAEHVRAREENPNSLALNAKLVPLDGRPLLEIDPSLDAGKQGAARMINTMFGEARADLMRFHSLHTSGAPLDEQNQALLRAEAAATQMDVNNDRLTTEPYEDESGRSGAMITDIYTHELVFVATAEIRRFTRMTMFRMALEAERWDMLIGFAETPEEQLACIHRMNGLDKYVELADWTLENNIQKPMSAWWSRNFFGRTDDKN